MALSVLLKAYHAMSASDYLDPTLSNIHIIIDIIFFVFMKSVVDLERKHLYLQTKKSKIVLELLCITSNAFSSTS